MVVFSETSLESDNELSSLVQLHKSLLKRSKWFTKYSQNVQNGSKHDFSQNASKTCATVMQQVFKTTKMAYYFLGILWIYFKRLVSSCGFSRGLSKIVFQFYGFISKA